MAVVQVIILSVSNQNNFVFDYINIIFWLFGFIIFLIINKFVFFRINENAYTRYSNIFLFIIGFSLFFDFFI